MNNTLSPNDTCFHADAQEMTSVRAYFLAESAGFAPGRELEFWLQAESETRQALQASVTTPEVALKPKRAPRKKVEASSEVAAPSIVTEAPAKRTRRKPAAE